MAIGAHPDDIDFGTPAVLLCFGGILLTAVLVARRVPGEEKSEFLASQEAVAKDLIKLYEEQRRQR